MSVTLDKELIKNAIKELMAEDPQILKNALKELLLEDSENYNFQELIDKNFKRFKKTFKALV